MSSVDEQRAQLWDAGFRPVPIFNADANVTSPGKQPLGNDWRQAALQDPPFCVSHPSVAHASNTGILCDTLRPIDIDIDDPAMANRVRSMAVQRFGEAPIRMRRNSARCLILLRAASGAPTKLAITGVTHTTGNALKVEVLGAGQQFVAFGRHDSGADLEWFPEAPGEVTADSLPSVTEEDILAFLEAVAAVIGAEPPGKPNGKDHYAPSEAQAEPLRIAAAVANIPNSGPADWEAWNRIGMAIFAATGGSAIGGELFNEWSRRNLAYDPIETENRWKHYRRSPPTIIGAGTLFHLANGAYYPTNVQEEPPKWLDEIPIIDDTGPLDDPSEWLVTPAPSDTSSSVFDPWNTLRPVAFPLKAIPARVRGFILSRATTIGADPCALAWSVLSACSAAISGDIRLLMKRHDQWSVPPAIWVSLVGAPSTKKSPIVDAAWLPLLKIQGGDLGRHANAMAAWKAIPKKDREEGDEPSQPRRLITHDATMEKIQEILSHQTRGIGVLRDELAGWIGSMEKYAPGKGGAADRAFWLQSYNGGHHVVDRVMRGTVAIENLLVTVCGGIQPDRLRQFGDLTDDGLWQRFVPIIVAPATLGTDGVSDHTTDLYREVVDGLLSLPTGQRLHLSPDAHLIRETIEARLHTLEQADVLGARFTGFIGKMMGLWGRLCLVMHLIQDPGDEVSELTAFNAHELLFKSVLPNAARVYTAMGGAGADIEATRSIAGYILTKSLRRIVISDLTSNVRVCRHKTVEDVRKLLSPLEAGGWLLPEKEFAPTAWLVNDTVHAFFADQAERERERRSMVRDLILGETTL